MDILERKDFQRTIFDPIVRYVMFEAEDPTAFCLCSTSGTSGNGQMLGVMSMREAPEWIVGTKPRVSAYGQRCFRLRNLILARRDAASQGTAILSLDHIDFTPELSALLADLNPDSVRGSLSMIIRITECIPEDVRARLSTVNLSGEPMTEMRIAHLKERFPKARIQAIYTMTDMLSAASKPSCGFTPINHYHPAPGVTFEIYEPDSDGFGDVLLTRTLVGNITATRYRTGDIGRARGPCECGAEETYEIIGRRGLDYVKMGPALLRREELDRVFALVPGLVDDYRAEVTEENVDGHLVGRIVLRVHRHDGHYSAELQARISKLITENLFMTVSYTLGDLVAKGHIAPLAIEFSEEAFPSGTKDIKIRQRL